jgi:GAF domain-containing protein
MILKAQYCPVCRGRGHVELRKICSACYGKGYLQETNGFFSASHYEALRSSTLLPEFLRSAMEVDGACYGNIQLFNSTKRTLTIAAHQGFKEEFLRYFAVVRPGSCACGAAIQRGARVMVGDVVSDPIFKDTEAGAMLLQSGVQAVQSTPLISSAGQFLGVMSTHYDRPRNLRQEELRELDTVSLRYVAMMEASLREAARKEQAKRYGGEQDVSKLD